MSGELVMIKKGRWRLRVLEWVKVGVMTPKQAAGVMGVSYRHAIRIKGRYEHQGPAGLTHRSRGQGSNRRIQAGLKKRVLRRYQERYQGFGPTLAMEKLEAEGYRLHHETLRRRLIQEWNSPDLVDTSLRS